MPETPDEFRAAPKVELHLHLEGAIRPRTVEELAHRFDPSFRLADWEWARPGFRYADLGDFVATMRRMLNMALDGVDDYARVVSTAATRASLFMPSIVALTALSTRANCVAIFAIDPVRIVVAPAAASAGLPIRLTESATLSP